MPEVDEKHIMDEAFKNKSYNQAALDPNNWRLWAETLKRAADNVYESSPLGIKKNRERHPYDHRDYFLVNVYYLLMGYALENLLKGLLIMQDSKDYVQQGKFTKKTHKIAELFKDCGLEADKNINDLLEKLTRHIEWMGRYPVPLEAKSLRNELYRGQDQKEINRIYEKVLQKFKNQSIKRDNDP